MMVAFSIPCVLIRIYCVGVPRLNGGTRYCLVAARGGGKQPMFGTPRDVGMFMRLRDQRHYGGRGRLPFIRRHGSDREQCKCGTKLNRSIAGKERGTKWRTEKQPHALPRDRDICAFMANLAAGAIGYCRH